jgi:hypothetical protein
MIIKFFSSFCDSKNCKDVYERLCEVSDIFEYNKTIKFTINDDFTHAIIINCAMPTLNIPKERVIGLAFEPPAFLNLSQEFINYAIKNISKYYIGDKNNLQLQLPLPFIEHHGYMWHITPLKSIAFKSKLMSIIISEKIYAFGHLYRHKLVKKILENNLPIDIWGRGCIYYDIINDDRIKGNFTDTEPYLDYKFHICIENYQLNEYFSEKITNTLLTSTTPIYFGCHNIDNYFPEQVIKLSGNENDDILLIMDIVSNPNKYIKKINLNLVKDNINLIKNINSIFDL